jgi:hypothetical protein
MNILNVLVSVVICEVVFATYKSSPHHVKGEITRNHFQRRLTLAPERVTLQIVPETSVTSPYIFRIMSGLRLT